MHGQILENEIEYDWKQKKQIILVIIV